MPIWKEDEAGWAILSPSGFPDEAALHDLVERSPHLLPLSGGARLIAVGREIPLGSGSADLLAVEPNGRLAIVEIKLKASAESRRAVVAQALAYAAYLHGMDRARLESEVLARSLQKRGYSTLSAAVKAEALASFDAQAFDEGVRRCLETGEFRVVLVLDEAPQELVRLVGYLERMTSGLLIDLVTISAYQVGETRLLVPQRVEPGLQERTMAFRADDGATALLSGSEGFEEAIKSASETDRAVLEKLVGWAKGLEGKGLARLQTYRGKLAVVLLPRLLDDDVGLTSIYYWNGPPLWVHPTVVARRAPLSLERVRRVFPHATLNKPIRGQAITDDVLGALTEAYVEASKGKLPASPRSVAAES